jgi:transposase
VAELGERGTPASYGAVWRFFKDEGIAFKKASSPASRTAPMSPAGGPAAAYSPDLNPIEQVFTKLKTLLRKADPWTIENTWRQIGTLLACFTANYPQRQLRLKKITL